MHVELIALLALPVPALALLWALPGRWAKYISVGVAALQSVYTLYLCSTAPATGLAYGVDLPWFGLTLQGTPLLNVRFALGAGGLQWLMLLLSGLVLTLSAVSAVEVIRERERGYHGLFLLLCIAIPGCFVAQDAFLFYVFFEIMLIPMYFLVGLWGGQRREFAAIQFFIYTLAGSLLILAGFAVSYLFENPGRLLGLGHLPVMSLGWQASLGLPGPLAGLSLAGAVFWVLLIGFMIKLPAVPLHTWLPVAHTEAPTPVSILLAGVLLKTGGYGIFYWTVRLFPTEAALYANAMAGLGAISIVYAAFLALAAHDLKRLVACSSISHMGFVLVGLGSASPVGYQGAAFQLFSHGVLSAGLFAGAGALQHLTGTRDLRWIGGLSRAMPRFTGLLAALFFAGMGLPGFSGFIGEFLVVIAAWGATAQGTMPLAWPLLMLFGLLLTSGYFLWALRRLFMGTPYVREGSLAGLKDVHGTEAWLLWITVLLSLALGLYPKLLLDLWDGVM